MQGFVLAFVLMVVLALGLALAPLWRRALGQALALAALLAAGTVALYAGLGTPDALDPRNLRAPESLEEGIAMLERRLADEPGSVEGWVLLARARMSQQQWAQGRDAFARAHALLPDEPDLMVEYADALMRASDDGRFPAEATALLERVVQGQPTHQRGLFYLGAQRLQAGQAAEAAALWERLLPLVQGDTAEALKPQIAAARAQAGLPAPVFDAAVAATGPVLRIRVELDPSVAAARSDGDVLFVFARTADGAGLPVAVKRLPAAAFPVELELSDADGLMPAQKLSGQTRVRLMARLSRSGDAAGASGDLEAEALALDVADGATATLRLSKLRP